ncbi:MAG: nucleoside-diphosphate sugar epimerase/dehydratase [Planctomycetota bacterium]
MRAKSLLAPAASALLVAVVTTLCYLSAYLLRFAGNLEPSSWLLWQSTLPVVVAMRVGLLVRRGGLPSLNRYFSFHDLIRLVRTVTLGTLGLVLVDTMLYTSVLIPRSVLMLDWGVTVLALAGVSSVPRLFYAAKRPTARRADLTPALIVGANDAGEQLLRAIRLSPKLNYQPVGFVDDRARRVGQQIGGVPVLGPLSDLAAIARRLGAEQVLITSGQLPGVEVRRLMNLAEGEGFEVRVLPSYEQLLNEDVAVRPREVAIEDLLRRPAVKLDTGSIHRWLDGRVVMVTGSAGSIGSEIARQVLELGPSKVLLVDRSETGQFFLERELAQVAPDVDREVIMADLTDRDRLETVFREAKPDIIFHAAAYKHVPLMESHPGEAVKNIILATRHVADLAEQHGAEAMVMISTDKAVNPTSVMGSCKRVAEQYVQSKDSDAGCQFVTVRFGNVLDSAGSVVPIFRQQIADGGPVTITHPQMVRFFMLIPEAAQLVIQAGAMGRGGEVFVLDMGQPVLLMDLARDMIRLSGLREGEDIEIVVSGLRPGEKLYEELYGENERHHPTEHTKIMVAASPQRSPLAVLADVNRLIDAANDPPDVVRPMLREVLGKDRITRRQPVRAVA